MISVVESLIDNYEPCKTPRKRRTKIDIEAARLADDPSRHEYATPGPSRHKLGFQKWQRGDWGGFFFPKVREF